MSGQRQRQPCRKCGAPLASDNRDDVCSPCGRREQDDKTGPPALPVDFWDGAELRKALATHEFGVVLKAYRMAQDPEVKQTDLALWLGIGQSQVSRIERRVTAANDLGKLDRWARTLGIPQRCLWFSLSEGVSSAYDSAMPAPHLEWQDDEEGNDMRRRQLLKTAGVGALTLGAGILDSGTPAAARVTRAVGHPEVQNVREITQAFRRLDNRYGGGHSKSAVARYLSSEAEPLLRDCQCTSAVRRELFTAVAELHQLIGWMDYDTGDANAGRKHLRYALRLCQEGKDDALAAEMLAGMSHHAAFYRAPEAALDLALAARQTASRTGLPALQAETAVMEAHGLALHGDRHGCVAALHAAEHAFSAMDSRDVPEWLEYFDGAYLAAKFGHVFRDLGQPKEAEQFARRSLEMNEGYERGRQFNTALLASVLADQGEVEEACVTASLAVRMAGDMRSARTGAYLADVGRRLAPYRTHAAVNALYKRMRAARILVQQPHVTGDKTRVRAASRPGPPRR